MEDDAHAKYVNLHIQIVNYHTKITQLMDSLESSVRTRIGFVPRDIQHNIEKVRQLPVSSLSNATNFSLRHLEQIFSIQEGDLIREMAKIEWRMEAQPLKEDKVHIL